MSGSSAVGSAVHARAAAVARPVSRAGWALVGIGLFAVPQGHAAVGETDAASRPTPSRLPALPASARGEGGAGQAVVAGEAAFLGYERERFAAAEAWINVARWAELFGQKEGEFVPRWLTAVRAANVAHSNMARNYTAQDRTL